MHNDFFSLIKKHQSQFKLVCSCSIGLGTYSRLSTCQKLEPGQINFSMKLNFVISTLLVISDILLCLGESLSTNMHNFHDIPDLTYSTLSPCTDITSYKIFGQSTIISLSSQTSIIIYHKMKYHIYSNKIQTSNRSMPRLETGSEGSCKIIKACLKYRPGMAALCA